MKILHLIDHLGLGGAQSLLREICVQSEEFYCYALRRIGSLQVDSKNLMRRNCKNKFDLYMRLVNNEHQLIGAVPREDRYAVFPLLCLYEEQHGEVLTQ